MKKQNVQCFVMIDKDRKMFSVIPTIESDLKNWNKRITEQQKQGRDILGYSSEKSVEKAISEFQNQYKYANTSMSAVLNIYKRKSC